MKTFTIGAEIIVLTNRTVQANSFQEAVERADRMSLKDFVTLKGDHIDSRVTISDVGHSDLALYNGD